jgi:hypothetical protein
MDININRVSQGLLLLATYLIDTHTSLAIISKTGTANTIKFFKSMSRGN